jgi:membrane protease YdiL (CAAX protease family)
MWNATPSMELTPPALIGLAVAAYLMLLAVGTITALALLVKGVRHPPPWSSLSETLRTRAWTWRDGITILGVQLLLLLIAMVAASLLGSQTPIVLMVLETALFDCAGLAFLWIYLKRQGLSWLEIFGTPSMPLGRAFLLGALFYLAMLPILVFSSIIYQGILSANGYPPSLQEVALLLAGNQSLWVRLYMVFLAVILAPAFEECLFRGIALPLLARRLGVGPAILATSAIFALIHFHLPSFIPLCVVASAFSLAYLYTRSLWVPIVMHSLFNAVNVALLILMTP